MRIVLALVLALLAACQSAPDAKKPANVEQFIQYCQAHTGSNFTYAAETGVQLRERGFRLEGSDQRSAEALMELLRTVLVAQSLELVRVGPEHLNTWLVRPMVGQRG